MSELSNTELSAFTSFIAPLCDSFANSLSENINQYAVFDIPSVTQKEVIALMSDASAYLLTTFTYPMLSTDDVLLLFPENDALVMADLVGGGDGSSPPALLETSHMDLLTAAMSGTVQGMGLAIGTARNSFVAPGPATSTQIAPLTLTEGFLTQGAAIEVVVPYRVEGLLDSMLRLLLTPAAARALAGIETAAPIEEPMLVGAGVGASNAGFGNGVSSPMGGFGSASAFQPFEPLGGAPEAMPRSMDLIMDIPLEVSVELGRVQMLIKDVLELATGSIVELERVAGEPIDLLVNGQLIAKGEVVVIEDNFGIRITEIVSPADRLQSMGKRG